MLVYNYKQKLNNKKYNTNSSKKKIFILLLLISISVVVIAGVYIKNKQNISKDDNVSKINYEPATEEEKKQADDNKDRIVKEQQKDKPNPIPVDPVSNKKSVVPTITNTNGSINAYVTGIFEEGGECTATFTKNSETLTKSSVGFENVSYTQCAPMTLESGFLSTGKWTVSVKYSSASAEGTSATQTIEVQ